MRDMIDFLRFASITYGFNFFQIESLTAKLICG
jgi:hypothetical protein